jgi:hypothetical protein
LSPLLKIHARTEIKKKKLNDGLARTSALFNRTNIIHDDFCVTRIKYIMYNVQDYSILYNWFVVRVC